MTEQDFVIEKAALEKAKNGKDAAAIKSLYEKAARTIKAGGVVKIEQQFSDASEEIAKVIDRMEQLDRYFGEYS